MSGNVDCPSLLLNGVGMDAEEEVTPLPNANPEVFAWQAPNTQPPALEPTPLQVEDIDDYCNAQDMEEQRRDDDLDSTTPQVALEKYDSEAARAVRIKLPSLRSQPDDSFVAVQEDTIKSSPSGVRSRFSTGTRASVSSSAQGEGVQSRGRRFLSVISRGDSNNLTHRETSGRASRDRSFLSGGAMMDRVRSQTNRKTIEQDDDLFSLKPAEEDHSWWSAIVYNIRLLRLRTWLFMEEPWETLQTTIVHGAVVVIIFASILHRITLHDEPEAHDFRSINGWNVSFNSVLLVDLLVRFWAFPLHCRFLRDPKNVIDLVNLVPFLLNDVMDLPRQVSGLAFLEFLSTYETFLRLLKLSRYFTGWQLLFHAVWTSARALLIPILFLILIVSFGSCSLYVCETLHARDEIVNAEYHMFERTELGLTTIRTLPDAIHFSIICILSIGTGPFYRAEAASLGGKIVVMSMMAFGMLFMAMPIAIVGACFSQTWFDQDRIVLLYKVKSRLHAQGYTPEDLYDVFQEVDADSSGQIEFGEFKRMIDTFNLPGQNVTKCRRLFLYFDHDSDGAISFEDFAHTLFPELTLLDEEFETESDFEGYEEMLPPIGEQSYDVSQSYDVQVASPDKTCSDSLPGDQEKRGSMCPSPIPVSPSDSRTLHTPPPAANEDQEEHQDISPSTRKSGHHQAQGDRKQESVIGVETDTEIKASEVTRHSTSSKDSIVCGAVNSTSSDNSTMVFSPSPQQQQQEEPVAHQISRDTAVSHRESCGTAVSPVSHRESKDGHRGSNRSTTHTIGHMRFSDVSLHSFGMNCQVHDESNIVAFPKGPLKRLHSNSSVMSHLPFNRELSNKGNLDYSSSQGLELLKKIEKKMDQHFERIMAALNNRGPQPLFQAPQPDHHLMRPESRSAKGAKSNHLDVFKQASKSVPASRANSNRPSATSLNAATIGREEHKQDPGKRRSIPNPKRNSQHSNARRRSDNRQSGFLHFSEAMSTKSAGVLQRPHTSCMTRPSAFGLMLNKP